MTIDLKSGSKVNIGTHAITLDKFFDGQLKAQRWLDIGNGEGSPCRDVPMADASVSPSPSRYET